MPSAAIIAHQRRARYIIIIAMCATAACRSLEDDVLFLSLCGNGNPVRIGSLKLAVESLVNASKIEKLKTVGLV